MKKNSDKHVDDPPCNACGPDYTAPVINFNFQTDPCSIMFKIPPKVKSPKVIKEKMIESEIS